MKVFSTLDLDAAYAKASKYREKGFAVQLLREKFEKGHVVYSVDAIPLEARGIAPIDCVEAGERLTSLAIGERGT